MPTQKKTSSSRRWAEEKDNDFVGELLKEMSGFIKSIQALREGLVDYGLTVQLSERNSFQYRNQTCRWLYLNDQLC